MNLIVKYFKILFILIIINLIITTNSEDIQESNELNENDIPVVEGNGGDVTIKVEEDVYVLTKDNFDVIVLSKVIILVEFYAPWCGHCKSLEPIYAKAAQILAKDSPPIPLAKIDATLEESIASRYEVQGYPTLLVFRNGSKSEYDGPRTTQGIVDYMREKADPNWKPPPESVLTLTASNFDAIISKSDIILVEFYAPWCGHCKQLAPEYERAAKQLLSLPKPIKLAKIDATVEKELAQKYSVSGYPTLLVFRRGKHYKYTGPREESGIVHFMKEQLVSPSKLVSSVEQLKKSLTPSWPTIVGFFYTESSNSLYDVFIDTAYVERERSFKFLHIIDQKVINELKEKVNSIVLFQAEWFQSKFEPTRYRLPLQNSITVEEISNFIGNNSLPLVGQRTYNSQWLYTKYPLVIVYYDVDFSFEFRQQTQLTRSHVVKVANELKGEITFCIAKEEDYIEELKDLKLDDSGEDVNVGYFESPKIRYAMEPTDEFDANHLRKFVNNVRKGVIKRTIKSQPSPDRIEGPVTVVVGETFESLVTKSDKNVLIEFYAQWCGHCKKLEPIYKQLSLKFADNENLVIAKIDATANDYPESYDVSGFPTIYFVRRNDKNNPSLYTGDRSLEDLIKFVNAMLEHTIDRDEL